jgi:glycosyltransferase involved in cell wall biosynthesis
MKTQQPLVSVIITTHKSENKKFLVEAINSILQQTYPNIEILLVVDNNHKLYKTLHKKMKNIAKNNIRLLLNSGKKGISTSRNLGILNAKGEIVCFMDDDAIADGKWVEELVKTYNQYPSSYGIGGPIYPLGKIPWWLPEEFYWLIGLTSNPLHSNNITEVRNTFGSNISFKREIFNIIGLFNENLGLKREKLTQGDETEFCIRCLKKFNKGILYNPKAIIHHRILAHRIRLSYLIKRAFNQGITKALLKTTYEESTTLNVERKYLKEIIKKLAFKYPKHLLEKPKRTLIHMALSILFTATVVVGFIYGVLAIWLLK